MDGFKLNVFYLVTSAQCLVRDTRLIIYRFLLAFTVIWAQSWAEFGEFRGVSFFIASIYNDFFMFCFDSFGLPPEYS